jgi:hypothetical protein
MGKIYTEHNKPTPAEIGAIGDAGHSMGTSSYQKLSTGLIIQRGAISCPSGSTTTPTITFPLAFSSTNYTVVYTISNSDYHSYDGFSYGVSSMTKGSCKLVNDFNSNTKTLYWTAIGY